MGGVDGGEGPRWVCETMRGGALARPRSGWGRVPSAVRAGSGALARSAPAEAMRAGAGFLPEVRDAAMRAEAGFLPEVRGVHGFLSRTRGNSMAFAAWSDKKRR